MKKNLYLLLIAVFFITSATFAQTGAKISFKESTHDFGVVKQNNPATYSFEVKNDGNAPLFITNVEPSCGCTTPDWTKTPIQPGKTGFIKATFNAADKGPFNKSVYVKSNASNVEKGERYELKIKGEVK